jgi:hypothetical protein
MGPRTADLPFRVGNIIIIIIMQNWIILETLWT